MEEVDFGVATLARKVILLRPWDRSSAKKL